MVGKTKETQRRGDNGQIPQMKNGATYFKYSVIGVVVIVFLILLVGVFRSFRNKELNTHEDVIKAKDQTIEAIKESREAYQLVIVEKEKTILQLQKRDSTIQVNYINNQNAYKSIDAKLRNIPDYISRIANNDDSIRAAFSRFSNNTP